jgi:hypothetical protein
VIHKAKVIDEADLPRRLWSLFEPYHAITYFAPECRTAYKEVGLKGFWMGYFGGRAAPLGEASAPLVTATFYNFAPAMVRRSVPDVWAFATVEEILGARIDGADRALHRILGDGVSAPELSEAASLAEEAVRSTEVAGRPLFAANTELAVPERAHLRLWWAVTCLREHRGDGHIAALLNAGLDGCEAHVTFAATGVVSRSTLQPNRGWTDEEWSLATERLMSRGWLDAEGKLTPEGRAARKHVESDTDRMAREPWEKLEAPRTERLAALLGPIAGVIISSGDIPPESPLGLRTLPRAAP